MRSMLVKPERGKAPFSIALCSALIFCGLILTLPSLSKAQTAVPTAAQQTTARPEPIPPTPTRRPVPTPLAQGPESHLDPAPPPRCFQDSDCPAPPLTSGQVRDCVQPACVDGACTGRINEGAALNGQSIPSGVICFAHPLRCDSEGRSTANTTVKIPANQGNICQPAAMECEEYKCEDSECKRFARDRTPCFDPNVVAGVCQMKLCANYLCSLFADPGKAGTRCGEPQTANCMTTPRQCATTGACVDGTASLADNAQCAPNPNPSGPSVILAPPERLPQSFRDIFISSQTLVYSCNERCVLEYCGDGIVNGNESCDGTATGPGFPEDGTCDQKACKAHVIPVGFCGDGEIDGEEQCDGGAMKPGFPPEALCNQTTCTVEYCGDSVLNGNEDCDGATFKTGSPPGARCNQSTCKVEYCGDRVLNGEEECDGTEMKSNFPPGATCDQTTCKVNPVSSCDTWPPPPPGLTCNSDKACWVQEPDQNLCEDCWECGCEGKDLHGNCPPSGPDGFCKLRSKPHIVDPLKECPQQLAVAGDQVAVGAVCVQSNRVPSCDPSSGCVPGQVTTSEINCCEGLTGAALEECKRCTECQFVNPGDLYANPAFQQTLVGTKFDFLRNTDWNQGIGGNTSSEKPLVPSCIRKPECGGPPPPPPPSGNLLPPPPPPPPGPGVDCSDHRISQCVNGAPFMKDCQTGCCKDDRDGPCVVCKMAVDCPASLSEGKCVFVCPRGSSIRGKTGCFSEDTQILTPQGYVVISKLLRGDLVIDPSNGSAARVTEVVVGPEQEALYELTTASGASLRVTVYHPMPLASGEIVPASNVRVGDILSLGPENTPDRIVRVERNGGDGEPVWNLEVERTSAGNAGYVVADGIVTGDLAHQRALQGASEEK